MPADTPAETNTAAVDQARQDARAARLVHVSPDQPGIARRRTARGFSYRGPDGATVRDAQTLARIRSLAVPPAWEDVWICARPNGHLQAVGVDQKGRRQYRYHPRFRAVRDEAKFEHLLAFAEGLPALRARIAEDMARPGLGRDKVLATVAHLLEATMIRVGNEAYAKANGSFGLATLRNRHVTIEGGALRFHFKGKSGKEWRVGLRDRRVARIVRACQDLPGQHLFQYLDEAGERQTVTSADVNAYLRAASGRDITAKDFRTWWGTVLAALALAEGDPPQNEAEAKRRLGEAVKLVASRLGNTPTVCRKCYIHPEVPAAHLAGALTLAPPKAGRRDDDTGLSAEEVAVLNLLRERLGRTEAAAA
ncbi:MAG: DNA topoisomerase IB [Proteobacteria bacterium]|nr:DNA topoisomerase IB [Pseudomonadota bacterium]